MGSSVTRLTYDVENRVTGITYPNASTNTFAYNGEDLRVKKVDSGGTKNYVTDGASPASAVLSDGAAVYTPGLSERRGTASKFYHTDALGSTRGITDSTQATTDAQVYDAFGMTVSRTGSTPTPFGFVGKAQYQTDGDSGLQLLGHRYYDPSIGRFLSQDPIQDGDNWYAYCDNNPLSRTDPEGLADIDYKGNKFHHRVGDADTNKGLPHWDGPNGSFIGGDGKYYPGVGAGGQKIKEPHIHKIIAKMLKFYEDNNLTTLPVGSGGIPNPNAPGGGQNSGGSTNGGSLGIDDPNLNMRSLYPPIDRGDWNRGVGSGLGKGLAKGGILLAVGLAVFWVVCCFDGNTPVLMADGTLKHIKDISPGEWVMARNPQTGEMAAKQVLSTSVKEVKESITLTLANGEEIKTTDNHLFFVLNKGCIPAGEIAIQKDCLLSNGASCKVINVRRSNTETHRVYNLEVSSFHNYIVGKTGVWVHDVTQQDEYRTQF